MFSFNSIGYLRVFFVEKLTLSSYWYRVCGVARLTFRALSGARMHHRFGYPLARWITGPDVMIFPFSNFFMMISKCCFLFRTFWKDLPHQVLNCSFACLIGISGNSDPLVCLRVHHLGELLDDGLIVDLMTLDCDWLDWWHGRTNYWNFVEYLVL